MKKILLYSSILLSASSPATQTLTVLADDVGIQQSSTYRKTIEELPTVNLSNANVLKNVDMSTSFGSATYHKVSTNSKPSDNIIIDNIYSNKLYRVPLKSGESVQEHMKTFYNGQTVAKWGRTNQTVRDLSIANNTLRILSDANKIEIVASANLDPSNTSLRNSLRLSDDKSFHQSVLAAGFYNLKSYSAQTAYNRIAKSQDDLIRLKYGISDEYFADAKAEYLRMIKSYEYLDNNNLLTEKEKINYKHAVLSYESIEQRYNNYVKGTSDVKIIIDSDADIDSEEKVLIQNAVNNFSKRLRQQIGLIYVAGKDFDDRLGLTGNLGYVMSNNLIYLNGQYRSLPFTIAHEAAHILDYRSMYHPNYTSDVETERNEIIKFSTNSDYMNVFNNVWVDSPHSYFKNSSVEAFAQTMASYFTQSKYTDTELKDFGFTGLLGEKYETITNPISFEYAKAFNNKYFYIGKTVYETWYDEIKPRTKYEYTTSLPKGQQQVKTESQSGINKISYIYQYKNGVRVKVGEEVIYSREKIDKVILVGK